jgi:AcrR family transcriptional regulator
MDLVTDREPSRRATGKANLRRSAGDPVRRQELLDIAIRVIADRGLQACTFRTLAREAGASTMTYTYEFGTRDSLIEAIIERVFERAWSLRGFDRDDDADDPLGKMLRAANLAVQDEVEIDPFQRTLDRFVIEAPYSDTARAKIDELDARLASRYHALIEMTKEQGLIDTELETDDILMMIWSLGDGLNIQRYAHPEQLPPERMRQIFNDGLARMLGLDRVP